MSLWTMGFNQHVRGVWANHMVYNIHLLTGKIAEPGNSPFSLTGQPSACGTAREVGTFSHRLPADMQVTNPEHRKKAEEIWKLPAGLLPDKVGYHAVQQDRMLKDGKLNAYWIQVNNNLQAAPNSDNETYVGYRNPDNFIVVSDAYPTVTAMAADLVLPAAMWVEKEGAYGNAERRTHFWHQLVTAPGEARSDLWQLMEFSKRFTTDEVWPAEILDQNPQYRGKTLYEVLYAQRLDRQVPGVGHRPGIREPSKPSISGSTSRKGCSRNTPPSGATTATTSPISTSTTRCAACAGRWWTTRKRCWRYREGLDPYVKEGEGINFYGNKDGRAIIFGFPYEPPAEAPDAGIRHVAGDRPGAGTLAFGLHDHARAGTLQGGAHGAGLHAPRRRGGPQAAPGFRSAGQSRAAAKSACAWRRAAATSRRAALSSCPGSTAPG